MEVLFIVIQMTIELFFPFYFLLNAKKPCCIGDKYHVNEEFVLQRKSYIFTTYFLSIIKIRGERTKEAKRRRR